MKKSGSILFILAWAITSIAQDVAPEAMPAEETRTPETAMLLFHGKELFEIAAISDVPVEQGVESLQARLKRFAQSPLFHADHLRIKDDKDMKVALIFSGDQSSAAIREVFFIGYDFTGFTDF